MLLQGKGKWLFIREWFRRLYLIKVLAWLSPEMQLPTTGNVPVASTNAVRDLEEDTLFYAYCVIYGGDHDGLIDLQFNKGRFCSEELMGE